MEDEMDVDMLLAEAEQEQHIYNEYAEDMEAELAMEAEALTTTPSGGASVVPRMARHPAAEAPPSSALPTVQVNRGYIGIPETVLPLSSARLASPLSLDRRLGVEGTSQEEEEEEEDASPHVTRALNREGLSTLNPVLRDDLDSNRWSGRRLVTDVAATSRAIGRRPRLEETSAPPRIVTSTERAQLGLKVDTRGVVLSRPAMDCDTIPFMQSGGRMMHLRVRSGLASDSLGAGLHEGNSTEPQNASSLLPHAGNLLRTPMSELMSRVDERRVIERSLATAAVDAAVNGHEVDSLDGDEVVEEGEDELTGAGATVGRGGRDGGRARGGGVALWVDKYAPEGFRDLLSDEKINREVLRAVKAWDPFVFKKEAKATSTSDKTFEGLRGRLPGGAGAGGDNGCDPRPDAKVIMLCGPPGLGKTTLAQVVARHAGYRVYEINASDDRTAGVLRQRMTEAMEGNTLLADKRPNLIVLDEVDGADGKAAAQVIVDMATAPLAKAGAASRGKKSKRKALTRPLILICNDQWTPALRPIRALAQVFVFRPTASPARLVQRLKVICSAETLCVNTDALTRLADSSHLDVRSCLNTLQFVARRAAVGTVRNASAALWTAISEGVKDEKRDLFQVLRSVFTRKRPGTKRRLFVSGEQGQSWTYIADKHESDVLEAVECFNDHQKVLAGIHESFLGVRFNDPTLAKASAAIDWLDFADLMDARTNRTQDYSFTRYAPLAAAGVHFLCRSDQRVAVSQPKKEFEVRTARAAKANILQSFSDGRRLGSTGRTPEAIVLDMLSHLMDILAPALRPLNPDLQSAQERDRFRNLVRILITCGLTFAPTSAGGSGREQPFGGFPGAMVQEFALEPAIDQLLRYDGYGFAHPMLPGPLRPIVAHEVNLEIMRHAEVAKTQQRSESSCPSLFPSDMKTPPANSNTPLDNDNNTAATVTASQHRLPFTSSSNTAGAAGTDPGNGTDKDNLDTNKDANECAPKNAAKGSGGSVATGETNGGPAPPTEEREMTPATVALDAVAIAGAKREDDRPAHVVPFWNRTNWVAGRKDGSGADGAAVDKRGGGDPASGRGGEGKGVRKGGLREREEQGTDSKRPRNDGHGDGGEERQDGRVLRYQFRAGYTNAVRRPVRMKDLM